MDRIIDDKELKTILINNFHENVPSFSNREINDMNTFMTELKQLIYVGNGTKKFLLSKQVNWTSFEVSEYIDNMVREIVEKSNVKSILKISDDKCENLILVTEALFL